ncbi:hypothetical protein V8C86DRAFT_1401631 [Haematococcus lacustris]
MSAIVECIDLTGCSDDDEVEIVTTQTGRRTSPLPSTAEEGPTCPICLQDIVEEADVAKVIPCTHAYCAPCITLPPPPPLYFPAFPRSFTSSVDLDMLLRLTTIGHLHLSSMRGAPGSGSGPQAVSPRPAFMLAAASSLQMPPLHMPPLAWWQPQHMHGGQQQQQQQGEGQQQQGGQQQQAGSSAAQLAVFQHAYLSDPAQAQMQEPAPGQRRLHRASRWSPLAGSDPRPVAQSSGGGPGGQQGSGMQAQHGADGRRGVGRQWVGEPELVYELQVLDRLSAWQRPHGGEQQQAASAALNASAGAAEQPPAPMSTAAAAAMFGHEASQQGHSSLLSQEVGHNPPQPSAAGNRATQHSMAAVQDAIAATAALVDRLQSRLAPRLPRPRPSADARLTSLRVFGSNSSGSSSRHSPSGRTQADPLGQGAGPAAAREADRRVGVQRAGPPQRWRERRLERQDAVRMRHPQHLLGAGALAVRPGSPGLGRHEEEGEGEEDGEVGRARGPVLLGGDAGHGDGRPAVAGMEGEEAAGERPGGWGVSAPGQQVGFEAGSASMWAAAGGEGVGAGEVGEAVQHTGLNQSSGVSMGVEAGVGRMEGRQALQGAWQGFWAPSLNQGETGMVAGANAGLAAAGNSSGVVVRQPRPYYLRLQRAMAAGVCSTGSWNSWAGTDAGDGMQ